MRPSRSLLLLAPAVLLFDSVGNKGDWPVLAFDVQGKPRIAYRDANTSALKYAKWR